MADSLADLLKAYRSASRLSQEALAERAGVSTRTVSDIETGFARSPRLMTVMLLAEALGLGEPDRALLQAAARRPGKYLAPGVPERRLPPAPVLVGRDVDVAAIRASLEERGTRLLTISGPAGVGKTSVAVRVATDVVANFANGAAFVELAAVSDPARVPAAVAEALGLREVPGAALRDSVVAGLRDMHLLLVLDNLEHLAPAAPWIGELLAACERLTIVATSREPLRLRLEHVYPLQPLETAAALELFVQLAQAVKPRFALTGSNRAVVASIVGSLEGLPLAIELAAPRLTILPPAALAARLERRLPLLGDGPVDLPQRQRTMRAAIAWSYDLLSADEQRLFRRISVLRGATIDAARDVAGDASSEDRPFLLRLADLVEKSLLALQEDAEGEPRVVMLEMLREFAHERLSESDELDEARRRQANYFVSLAESALPGLAGPDQALWIRRFEREHANLRAALQWAIDGNEIELGLRLAVALWRFWWMRGNLSEARDWLRALLERVPQSDPPVSIAVRAKGLRALVVMLSGLGDFNEGLGPCEDAIRLQREIGDDANLANSLNSLGIILHFLGDNVRSRAAHEESLAIRRARGEENGIAASLSNLASIAYSEGDLVNAEDMAKESARLRRRLGDKSGLAHSLIRLGLVDAQRSSFERAAAFFEESLAIQRELGDAGAVIYSVSNLALVTHRSGKTERALELFYEVLGLVKPLANRAATAPLLEGFAGLLADTGEPNLAARLIGAANALRQTIESPMFAPEKAYYDATLATVRSAIGSERLDGEWAIGAAMDLADVLDAARRAAAGPAPVHRPLESV